MKIVQREPFTLPVAKFDRQLGVLATPKTCVPSQTIILLSSKFGTTIHSIIRFTIVHTHSSGYRRTTRLSIYSFFDLERSREAVTRNPLIAKSNTTPGKKCMIDTIVSIAFIGVFVKACALHAKCPSITLIAAQ